MAINLGIDCLREKLELEFQRTEDTTADLFLMWLHKRGATSPDRDIAEREFLTRRGIKTTANQPSFQNASVDRNPEVRLRTSTMWMDWLAQQGAMGETITQRWKDYWCRIA